MNPAESHYVFYQISVWALPVLLAITLHEAGHAWMADRLGDPTARLQGRVSFNPLVHIDPMGTILFPGFLFLVGAPFLFGWAKPVPVDYRNLRQLPRDIGWVAAAGPLANVLLILLSAVAFSIADMLPHSLSQWVKFNAFNSIIINAILAAFNFLPVPPLDGSKVLQAIGPRPMAEWIHSMQYYGMMPIIVLIIGSSFIAQATGVNPIGYVLSYAVNFAFTLVGPLMGAG